VALEAVGSSLDAVADVLQQRSLYQKGSASVVLGERE
jgi:hypothetical protein